MIPASHGTFGKEQMAQTDRWSKKQEFENPLHL